jgi:4-amino-4-deoxychorismate lyase
MCRLIETIKIKNREIQNIGYHNLRLNYSRKALFNQTDQFDLQKLIIIPENIGNELYKCRVVYKDKIESIDFVSYVRREIKTLKLIDCNSIYYDHKYLDRSPISELYNQKEDCDDILIVKNGLLTDTSYCNIAFYDGNCWHTPALPLLKGTNRAKLIDEKVIIEKDIRTEDIGAYSKACIFNAMIDFSEMIIEVNNISW